MFYAVVRAVLRLLLWIFTELEVEGTEHVPSGPALMVCNHVNLMDPVVPIAVLKRRVTFMAKEEVFATPFLGPILRALQVVPVARGRIASRRALQRAEEFLRRGWLFCMYPEGTRSRRPGMGPGHAGAALLALRTGVPIVPAAITGTHLILPEGRIFPCRGPVTFRIGEPFRVERATGRIARSVLEHLTEMMMRRVAALLPPEYRGVYALEPASAQVQE
ncbi:MAG: lysophospholipid acyltransferase family protein [Chloroflexia bacterium]